MAYIDDLKSARNNVAARLKEITESPRPDYSLDGESISWSGYFSMLTGQLESLNKAIQAAQPYQKFTRGFT